MTVQIVQSRASKRKRPIIRYEYLPKQLEFMNNVDTVPFSSYIGGFGSGKTHVLVIQCLREAQVPGTIGLIGAATYRMLQDTTQRKFFDLCPPTWIKPNGFAKSENRVHLINGSEIMFRSLDSPGRLSSLELDWFGLDEIGETDVETFRMLQGRLRRPGGRLKGFGVGNPAGPIHWSYEYFVTKARKFPNRYKLVQATSYENTFLVKQYTDEMDTSYGIGTVYHKRFVLGQFIAFEGAYWVHFDPRPYPDGHVIGEDKYITSLLDMSRAYFGRVIDFGFEHPFTCMWFVTDGDYLVFFDEYYQRQRTIKEHVLQIREREKKHMKRFGVHDYLTTWTDHDAQCRTEIENVVDSNNDVIGFPCAIADKAVFESIVLVQSLWEAKRIFITDECPNALIEIPSYRAKPRRTAKQPGSLKEEPIKERDDTCDCIRMACMMEMKRALPFLRYRDLGYEVTDLDNLEHIIENQQILGPVSVH